MEQNSVLLYERKEKIGFLIINRPKARNAFNQELVEKLGRFIRMADQDPDTNVIVISAVGDKAFSAGFDIKESIGEPIVEVTPRRENTKFELETWREVWKCKKPVIASVQGFCIGGGLHLAFMSDLIIASEDAVFGEPEVAFSYVPDILIEPWKLPMNKVRQLLYLGEYLTAEELRECGVVNKVVAREKLGEETERMAKKIADMPADTMAMLKYQVNKTYEIQGMNNAMDFAAEIFNLCRINQAQTQKEFNDIVTSQGLKAALDWKTADKNHTAG
ncbi:enoyl-CoA hydratase-related protein [[Clostridium] symbiosum]|uniref:enoyl-CoA hydratase-related protein n=1 Tax=Clostridium symbiosum TaxID=1512 RepID=UPI001D07043C|nr:enoyl-CoA hydratase-related protein [[Clostridium] symbiosum]MCB6610609.1 enoyl-CoA hydratase/isomerase family protein [[Clostridium] symbiosum]MCB6930945.1 enoyl-CoA hydratase/isomerase family protein [[Clostridium] symbiosum]